MSSAYTSDAANAAYASDATNSAGAARVPRPVSPVGLAAGSADVSADMLLLGEPGTVGPLRAKLGRRATVAFEDPYDAILSLHEKPCRCVVVTAPQPELPGLCRALRRVHGRGTLVAVGSPAGEPAMRSLTPAVLDDYFIAPPTPADVERIRGGDTETRRRGDGDFERPGQGERSKFEIRNSKSETNSNAENSNPQTATPSIQADAGVAPAIRVSAPVGGQVSLAPVQWAELLAATSLSSLREAVTRLLAAGGLSASWRRAEEFAAASPLLTVAGDGGQWFLVAADSSPAPTVARELLAALGSLMGALAKNAARIESLHKLAITDHLTGAYNRRYFYHLTEQILARAGQAGFRVTLLLYDIDDFKHYNRTFGHAAGDEILRQTAVLMKKTSRAHDLVARIGGDEFAVLFWDADPPRSPNSKPLESFVDLAERFRQAVRGHSFSFLGPDAKGTLSISGGLANFPADGHTCLDLLRAADAGLRLAKRQGKDRIYLAGK